VHTRKELELLAQALQKVEQLVGVRVHRHSRWVTREGHEHILHQAADLIQRICECVQLVDGHNRGLLVGTQHLAKSRRCSTGSVDGVPRFMHRPHNGDSQPIRDGLVVLGRLGDYQRTRRHALRILGGLIRHHVLDAQHHWVKAAPLHNVGIHLHPQYTTTA